MNLFPTTVYQELWKRFLKRQHVHSYSKGEIILLQEEEPSHISIIKSGIVKSYSISDDGDERQMAFDTEGEIFPIGWVFGAIEKTQYFYEAFSDCEVYMVKRTDFLKHIRRNPQFGSEMYMSLAIRFVSLQARIYALTQPKASQKIIYTLIYLADRFGDRTKNDKTKLQIPLTQQELANFIGITRETTSTELKKLEKQKLFKHSNKFFIIDLEKLRALAE